jgi:hypothetical protein
MSTLPKKIKVSLGPVGGVQLDVDPVGLTSVRLRISWPEANKLQADIRQLCIAAGVTLIGD